MAGVDAISYVLRGGCPWRTLPGDLPPWRTAHRWFARLRDGDAWQDLNVAPEQSVASSGAKRGYDAGGKVWGRKRRVARDSEAPVASADALRDAASVKRLTRRPDRCI